ncbi:MAG: glycine zipper 2TM domain-containing protein [Gammaproteobacteria bacterium]|nr:glycine zipper 2TM domain-containing protein [Gammaproteobacteria bacterium]
MKTKTSKILILAGLMTISMASFADKKPHHHKVGYENSAYARVLEVTPVYREVRVEQPVKKCWQEPVAGSHRSSHHSSSAGATLAGGLIGGIIGHQFGSGRGNKLATAVGTIIGAQAGHDAGRDFEPYYDESYTRYQEVCEVQKTNRYEEIEDGFKVKYHYNGKSYLTHMPYNPGERIKINVTVNPVF